MTVAAAEQAIGQAWEEVLRIEKTQPKPPLGGFRFDPADSSAWQTWREKDGSWVPDGWLHPGRNADPPAFAPLPSEVLQTPAFDAACFAAGATGQPIDVVIPLAAGSRHDDAELRYCLRSLSRHFEELGQVWIVGHCPKWLHNVRHIPADDPSRVKDANILAKIELACREPDLSERFLFVSDDQVLLRPLHWDQLGPYFWDDLSRRTAWNTRWLKRLRATRDWLGSNGHPALHYDTHVPVPMEKRAFLDLADRGRVSWTEGDGVCVNTWYFNQIAVPSRQMGARKATVEAARSAQELRGQLAGRWFLGFNDTGFTPELRVLLDGLFPEKCRFEKAAEIAAVPAEPVPTPAVESSDRSQSDAEWIRVVPFDSAGLTRELPRPLCHWRPYNAAICDHAGRTLLVYRVGPHWGSHNALCELGEDLQPIAGTPRRLNREWDGVLSYEDPRFCVTSGGLKVVQTLYAKHAGNTRVWQAMSDLRDGTLSGGVPLSYAEAGSTAKNWVLFEWEGELWATYSVWDGRHVVLRWHGEKFVKACSSQYTLPWRSEGQLRGGTTYVERDGLLFAFPHSTQRKRRQGEYAMAAVAIEARPPFRVVGLTPTPIYLPERAIKFSGGWTLKVVFPMDAVQRGDDWVVSAGLNDSDVRLLRFSHDDLIAHMEF